MNFYYIKQIVKSPTIFRQQGLNIVSGVILTRNEEGSLRIRTDPSLHYVSFRMTLYSP